MNLKKEMICNTPLNPLFRQRWICLWHDKRGVIGRFLSRGELPLRLILFYRREPSKKTAGRRKELAEDPPKRRRAGTEELSLNTFFSALARRLFGWLSAPSLFYSLRLNFCLSDSQEGSYTNNFGETILISQLSVYCRRLTR